MEKLEFALKEALERNRHETEKWILYQKEYQQTIENLRGFVKKLEVEIMVPIGSKALLPGKLYRTNEVLVSHYGGIFSKCSSHQAIEICEHRLNFAVKRLEDLKKEEEMYINKLEMPYEGALAREDQSEIIEEYDEEKEKIWREKHKIAMKEYRIKENEQFKSKETIKHDDLINILNELEEMEDLEKELETLHIEDNETLQKLISGEIELYPEKERISRCSDTKSLPKNETITNPHNTDSNIIENNYTNNNTISNIIDFNVSEEDSISNNDDDIPAEFQELEREAENFEKIQQLIFFKDKHKQLDEEIKTIKTTNKTNLMIKLDKLDILDLIKDKIIILKDEIINESNQNLENKSEFDEKNQKQNKKISFAFEDEIKIFHESDNFNESISDSNEEIEITQNLKENKIEEVIDENGMSIESQSRNDFDLHNKSEDLEENECKTLQITFKHSANVFKYPGYIPDDSCDIIGSPADIYKKFCIENNKNELPTSGLKNELKESINERKSDELKEENVKTILDNSAKFPKKPIIKNKELVNKEMHFNKDTKSSEKNCIKLSERRSAGSYIIGEVIEHKYEPDPLPSENFVDTRVPKKRISRFKEMRSNK